MDEEAEDGVEAARVLTLGLRDRWFAPALLPEVLAAEGFTAGQIADRIQHELH